MGGVIQNIVLDSLNLTYYDFFSKQECEIGSLICVSAIQKRGQNIGQFENNRSVYDVSVDKTMWN